MQLNRGGKAWRLPFSEQNPLSVMSAVVGGGRVKFDDPGFRKEREDGAPVDWWGCGKRRQPLQKHPPGLKPRILLPNV